ncbi:hypothetical protein [Mycolicibacter arupensis]|uniref:Uncharacterized protein n=1 Tax=Mycolicibacter arupensis TaxID=342002 RepID=A0A5C7Y426_9MYCO|nr:hypothetical protein [Mycolicibacter arupensis]TXI55934.1 MAG: hypothetical protein E6Q54_11955 [Mycolicibacter arupensis]
MGTLATELRRRADQLDAIAAEIADINVTIKRDAAVFVEELQPAEVYNDKVDAVVARGQVFRAQTRRMASELRATADQIEAEGLDI